ncbi:MAG: DUF1178 family protein [Pseudomonadota bacterium]
MIRYTLACSEGHEFESWFPSADAFDALRGLKKVSCPVCGCKRIEKALMAPGVRSSGSKDDATAAENPLSMPQNNREAALAAIRAKIEANSEYVGMNFADEARAMHEGDVPSRSIYGEAHVDDAKSLLEDGVPVAPLPFSPRSRAN